MNLPRSLARDHPRLANMGRGRFSPTCACSRWHLTAVRRRCQHFLELPLPCASAGRKRTQLMQRRCYVSSAAPLRETNPPGQGGVDLARQARRQNANSRRDRSTAESLRRGGRVLLLEPVGKIPGLARARNAARSSLNNPGHSGARLDQVAGYDAGGSAPRKSSPAHAGSITPSNRLASSFPACSGRSAAAHVCFDA